MQISKDPNTIQGMFNQVATTYDLANRVLSLGIDKLWRKKASHFVPTSATSLLDLATGTGDLLFTCLTARPNLKKIIGLDFSENMLKEARKKTKPDMDQVTFMQGDAMALPFQEFEFDVVTMAFGIRNVENPQTALANILKVLKPTGTAIILEFSTPNFAFLRSLYLVYFRKVLPWLGGKISRQPQAYAYLNQSVEAWDSPKVFVDRMKLAGFNTVKAQSLTFGIAHIYIGKK